MEQWRQQNTDPNLGCALMKQAPAIDERNLSKDDGKFIQSNVLIEQKEKFSLYEYRIFYYVLRQVYRKEREIKDMLLQRRTEKEQKLLRNKFSEFEKEFTVRELCKDENRLIVVPMKSFSEMWNVKAGSVYRYVVDVLFSIKQKTSVFKFETLTADNRKHAALPSMFENAEYEEGKNSFSLLLTSSIIPYIAAQDGEFTILAINELVKLPTAYSMRLYELLIQYKYVGVRSFTLEDFCEKMHLEESYLKRKENIAIRIIRPALENINQTNIRVSYEYKGRGEGRTVHFYITPAKKGERSKDLLMQKAEDLVGYSHAESFIKFLETLIGEKQVKNKNAYLQKIMDNDETIVQRFYDSLKTEEKKQQVKDNEILEKYYAKLRKDAETDRDNRKLDLYFESPKLRETAEELKHLYPLMPSAIIKKRISYADKEYTADSLREEIERLEKQHDDLLSRLGYSADYLEIHYRCNICKDTGITENGSCICRKQRLEEARTSFRTEAADRNGKELT